MPFPDLGDPALVQDRHGAFAAFDRPDERPVQAALLGQLGLREALSDPSSPETAVIVEDGLKRMLVDGVPVARADYQPAGFSASADVASV